MSLIIYWNVKNPSIRQCNRSLEYFFLSQFENITEKDPPSLRDPPSLLGGKPPR